MSTRFLKVKIKSLAAEAKIIRLEETRSSGTLRDQLHEHRVKSVRIEARATHLAYGYLRGRTREQIENIAKTEPSWSRVEAMIKKYGPSSLNGLAEWATGKKQAA